MNFSLHLALLAILLAVFPASAHPPKGSAVAQTAVVKFPLTGAVKVLAVEPAGEPVRIELRAIKTNRLLARFPFSGFVREIDQTISLPSVRFIVINQSPLPQPLIVAIGLSPGGSDGLFEAKIIGLKDGKFRLLNHHKLETAVQGGFHVGYLGKRDGYGAAAWDFIWCVEEPKPEPSCREVHYDQHRYRVTLFPFDPQTGSFNRGQTLKSARKYGGHGEGAMRELGFKFYDLRRRMPAMRGYADY